MADTQQEQPDGDAGRTGKSKALDALRDRHAKVLDKLKRQNQTATTGGSSPASSGYNTPVPRSSALAQDSAFGKALRASCETTQAIYNQVTKVTDDLQNDLWQGTAELQACAQGQEATWAQFLDSRRKTGLRQEQAEELISRVKDISSEDMSVLLAAARAKLEAEEEAHAAAGQETRASIAELHGRMQGISSDRFDVKQQIAKCTQAAVPTKRKLATLSPEVAAIKAVVESRGYSGPEVQALAEQLAASFTSPSSSGTTEPEVPPSDRQVHRQVSSLHSQWEAQAACMREWQIEVASAETVDVTAAVDERAKVQSLLEKGRAQLAMLQRQSRDLTKVLGTVSVPANRQAELNQQLDEINVKIKSQQQSHESELASLRRERDMLHEELEKASRPAQQQDKDGIEEEGTMEGKDQFRGRRPAIWALLLVVVVGSLGFVLGALGASTTAWVSASPCPRTLKGKDGAPGCMITCAREIQQLSKAPRTGICQAVASLLLARHFLTNRRQASRRVTLPQMY